MHFSLGLIAVLLLLAVIITVLMRPDIFSKTLRGGGEENALKLRKVVSDEEFQARMKSGVADKKEDKHG